MSGLGRGPNLLVLEHAESHHAHQNHAIMEECLGFSAPSAESPLTRVLCVSATWIALESERDECPSLVVVLGHQLGNLSPAEASQAYHYPVEKAMELLDLGNLIEERNLPYREESEDQHVAKYLLLGLEESHEKYSD